MSEFDPNLMKLQYEILNHSAAHLASETGLPEVIISKHIKTEGWLQWWPEESIQSQISKSNKLASEDAKETGDAEMTQDELLASQSEQYIERARKRLQVYSLAKEIYLAQKYMKLESALITKAHDMIETLGETDAQGVKQLSALYKDLVGKSPLASLNVGQDDGGLPVAIIRDLTGR